MLPSSNHALHGFSQWRRLGRGSLLILTIALHPASRIQNRTSDVSACAMMLVSLWALQCVEIL